MKKVKLYEDFLSEAAFLDYSLKPETGRLKVGDKVIVRGPEGDMEDVIVSIEGGQYRLAKAGLQGTVPMMGESLVNEAAKLDLEAMMEWLEDHLNFVRTSKEFNGVEGGIWTTGENGEQYKGKTIYDYYSTDYKNRQFGVLNTWEKELNKRGWYSEWYDAGTVMIWPI